MNPICATVEKASVLFTLVWVIMTSEAKRAVKPPTAARSSSALGAWAMSGLNRLIRKPPALMMPACMRAETGVGVSIVSGSHPWKGNWADFRTAATTKRRAIVWSGASSWEAPAKSAA